MKTKTKTQHHSIPVFNRLRSMKNFKKSLFTNVNHPNSQTSTVEENIAHEYLNYQLEASKAYVNMPPR